MRSRPPDQYPLFDLETSYPNGFEYHPEFLTADEENALVAAIEKLELRQAPFREYMANRRIISFGWGYDDRTKSLVPGDPLPEFLSPLTQKLGNFIDLPADHIVEALVTEYQPGTGVGWHRDNESFEKILGVSLSGWCKFEMRKLAEGSDFESDKNIEPISMTVEPRSLYVMQNDSRWKYQHRVAPTKGLRYSITFRTLPAQ
ncbi:MAG: alpha-ketoglutarate-dependent dioxygenase AlkB [Candidatus Paceibacterota bacterium]